VVFALETRFARSSRREAIAVTVLEELTMKSWKVWVSRSSSLTSRLEVDSAGLKYLAACWTFLACPSYWAAVPWMTCCSPLRVLGSSVLKSWSRSTGAVVLSVPSVAPSSSLRFEFAPGVSPM
jgi:hypothetical protein